MTPKNKLFIGILAFMLIVNILIIFNLNQFYIRAILAFIFIITIPGLLIMLCLKTRHINFWEYLVYVVGLSVAFIMFAGLAVNWILPWLNITDKPLSLYPILISFNIILAIFNIIAYKRNKDLNFKPKFPSLSWLDRIFIIIPMCFPFMAVIGAFLLNNHGTNIITMIMLGAIAVYVFCIVLFRDKLNENVYPWAIWMIGLALLLMFSMRSWYFMGTDVVSEYHFFDLSVKNGLWDITNYFHVYNVCLTVNILPTILNIFIYVDSLLIFKLIIQLIFPIVLIILYLFFKKFSNSLFSFLATFFFISQIGFMEYMPSAIRQEIAFIFFGLMLLVLFSKEINPKIRNLLFVVFGFSMIVSHYSTSYIALALFLFTYILTFFYKKWENRKIKKGKLKLEEKSEFNITGILILLLLVSGFLWYSQITPASNNLIDFTHNSLNNFHNLFDEDMQMEGKSFLNQFKISPNREDPNRILQEEIIAIQNKTNIVDIYASNNSRYSKVNVINPEQIPAKFSTKFSNWFYLFLAIIKKLGYVFIFLGLIYSLIISKINKTPNLFLMSMIGIIFFIFVILITIVPLGTISYGFLRLYQQGLVILSLFTIIGINLVLSKINKKIKFILIGLFLVIYFLFFTGFFNQTIGANLAFSNLNNFGYSYSTKYLSNTEIISIKWLSSEKITKKVYASGVYINPLTLFGRSFNPDWGIFPQTLRRNSYVYAGNSEVFKKVGFSSLKFSYIPYSFPTQFLNDNKNLLYNNGGSEIFK